MKRNILVLAVLLGVLGLVTGSAGSIVAGLRHALRLSGRHPAGDAEDSRERLRVALAPISAKLDPAVWGEWLEPLPDDFDLAVFRASMPVLAPPLSQTIIDERESSRCYR
jgi:hypothetical protein